MCKTVQVAVPVPLKVGDGGEFYSYKVPDNLKDGVQLGKRVLIPFRNSRHVGFIVGFEKPPPNIKPRSILDVIDEKPLFDQKRLEFLKWVANYYVSSLGIVLKVAHPGGLGVRLRRLIGITDNGIKALDDGELSARELLVLRTVYNAKGITSKKLLALIESATRVSESHQGNELLNSLRRRSLIEFNYELKSNPKVKMEKIIVAGDGANLKSRFLERKPAKAQILEYVLTHGSMPLSDLKEIFGNLGIHLNWLEERGLIKIRLEKVSRDPFSEMKIPKDFPPELTVDQEIACSRLREFVQAGKYSPFLLHGVTGSGKTEVYLRTTEEVIKQGKEVVMLVPEISLTPQLVRRAKGRLGNQVAVIHSALSDGERFDAWRMASTGEVKVLIGARSAIFAPFKNLGMIVVDEEHDSSYKQDESPAYNARDLALVLGKITSSVVVLGSATPSLESYCNAVKHKFHYLKLPLRVENRSLPQVSVIDMKHVPVDVKRGESRDNIFSTKLERAIQDNYNNKRQTILFLNRRGFSTLIICPACGDVQKCPNCSVSLTYHVKKNSVSRLESGMRMCHLCGLSEKLTAGCANCGASVRVYGVGTQKVEKELKRLVPKASVIRVDRDAVQGKTKFLKLYDKIQKAEIDVIIGTQMVAKGHDLPGVTLVGVISADMSLGMSDFRSGERTFQLVTQVAGRAGRGEEPGYVIVQTYDPDHPSIKYALRQDSIGFLDNEIKLRRELDYPPFSRLVNVRFSGRFESETSEIAVSTGEIVRELISKLPSGTARVLGPSPCPIRKIRNRYRFQMLLKSHNSDVLHVLSRKILALTSKRSERVRVSIDMDPYNFN